MFKHNEEKLNKLNKITKNFYYSIGHRDYLHSSTVSTAITSVISVDELTVNLRQVIRTGFQFDDTPGEDDCGFVVLDNTVFYIKPNEQPLFKANKINQFQERMIALNNIAQSGLDLWYEPGKYLSRKVTIRPRLIQQHDFKTGHGIKLRVEKQNEHTNNTVIDLILNDVLIYRQYAAKPR